MKIRKRLAVLLSAFLAMVTIISGPSIKSKAATADITITLKPTNCTIYYSYTHDGFGGGWSDSNKATGETPVMLESALDRDFEYIVVPDSGYTCTDATHKDKDGLPTTITIGEWAKKSDASEMSTTWHGGQGFMLNGAGTDYEIEIVASSAPIDPPADPPAGGESLNSISIYLHAEGSNAVIWRLENVDISSVLPGSIKEIDVPAGKNLDGEITILPCRRASDNSVIITGNSKDPTSVITDLSGIDITETLQPGNAGTSTNNISTIHVTDPAGGYNTDIVIRLKVADLRAGEVTAPLIADAWDFGNDGVIDLTVPNTLAEAKQNASEVYYGNSQVTIDDLSGTCNITNVELVELPAAAVTISHIGGSQWNVKWNSNYYDEIPLKLTVTDGSGNNPHDSYVVIRTAGIQLSAISNTESNTNHGTQPGPDISSALNWDASHNRAIVATFYYPAGESYSNYKMIANIKWSDGSITTEIIDGVAESTCAAGGVKGGDYVIWRGTTSNEPVSVSVTAINASALSSSTTFGGVKYGSSYGVEINSNDYRWY